LRWRYLKSHRKHVARARLFFYRYGFLAVLIGRFLGPVRSVIPTVAGAMGMPQARFQLANVLSAAAWMPALLAPGYLAAISVDAAKHAQYSTLYSAIALCVIAIVIWATVKQKRAVQARRKISHRPMR
jgi:membrane protein DedA with SNARE-associated domain